MPYEPLANLPNSPQSTAGDLTETAVDQWFATWIAQLAPPDQRSAEQQWAKLTVEQKNVVSKSTPPGGPVESVQQALQSINAVQQQTNPSGQPTAEGSQNVPQATSTTAAGSTTPTVGTINPSTGDVSPSSTGIASGTPVQGTTQAAALINQYMTTPLWQGDNNDPQAAAAGLGVDYNSANSQYQKYLTSFSSAQRRTGVYNSNAQPMSETEFIQGLAQTSYGQWGPVIGMLAYSYQEQNGVPMPSNWASQIVAALNKLPPNDAEQLQTQMLNSVEQISTGAKSATGAGGQATNLDLEVDVNTFLQQLGTIAPSIYSGGTSGSSLTAGSPGSLIGQLIEENPATPGEQASVIGSEKKAAIDFLTAQGMPATPANITALSNPDTISNMDQYVSWMQSVGMKPTPAILEQLMTMPFGNPTSGVAPTGTGGAFLLDQIMPGTRVTYGAYTVASSNLTTQWEDAFGSAPNSAQIAWAVGKSATDIEDFINNSSSSIPGVTIGEKNDYENFIQGFDKGTSGGHGLSAQIDDSMISDLHQQITKASTGAPKPGKM